MSLNDLTTAQMVAIFIAMLSGGGLIGAMVNQLLGAVLGRDKNRADVTGVITDAFKDLTEDLRTELTRTQGDNKALRVENAGLRADMERLRVQMSTFLEHLREWTIWADARDRGENAPRPTMPDMRSYWMDEKSRPPSG